ncbi:hypothetical protein NUW58_g8724 [Xylaria curta]|uniref:Uncharacterized protein n=1 Tax=Xylaria curta TaxID=42375 RepID=A0ACC1N5R4_9PEZI|nr:hypothetical protein NUW58_g8724 [Xylaria curta]
MSSSADPSSTCSSNLSPLFTREALTDIEAFLASDDENIELHTRGGRNVKSTNFCTGLRNRKLAHGETGQRSIILFHDERNLQRLEAQDKASEFIPVYNGSVLYRGPNRTEEETREKFASVIREFEASDEAAAIAALVKTNLKGCTVNKVIVFGLGTIGYIRHKRHDHSFYEHAAARVVARAAQEVSSSQVEPILAQDPFYTTVCKKVLAEFSIETIDGFGAKGFCLIDDNTIVIGHHPSFPLREIIADMGRPALISMRAQGPVPTPKHLANLYNRRADVDSVRSRKMLEEYHGGSLPKQKVFSDNIWYVRKTSAN